MLYLRVSALRGTVLAAVLSVTSCDRSGRSARDGASCEAAPQWEVSLTAGMNHACALRSNRSAVCWGLNFAGESSPPQDTLRQVSAGETSTCGIRTDGSVICWGADQGTPLPAGAFVQISTGSTGACAISADRRLNCWGGIKNPRIELASPPRQVAVGRYPTCVLDDGGTVLCWSQYQGSLNGSPPGQFKQIDAGYLWACGVKRDGSVSCWGADGLESGLPAAPIGNFEEVSVGLTHACAVSTEGAVACWGNDAVALAPPSGRFTHVAAGNGFTCGERTNGSVVCWDNTGLALPTPDAFPPQPKNPDCIARPVGE
jgi:alpha-tubulin suppressor-like RCC1 family protein